jgi:hypothetical protein
MSVIKFKVVKNIVGGSIGADQGADVTDPGILWESMWSPWLYQDCIRTVEG